MTSRDSPFDLQIKLLMIGDSGKLEILPWNLLNPSDFDALNLLLVHGFLLNSY